MGIQRYARIPKKIGGVVGQKDEYETKSFPPQTKGTQQSCWRTHSTVFYFQIKGKFTN